MPRFKHQKSKKQIFVSDAPAQAAWSELELAMLGAACGGEADDETKLRYASFRWPTRQCSPQRIQAMFPNRSWSAIKFQCSKNGWYPGPAPN